VQAVVQYCTACEATENSEGAVKKPRFQRAAAALATGIAASAALVATAAFTATPAARQADIVTHWVPPPGYYLAHDRGGQVDHHVLYHGTDSLALARMREARVLFLGNSRLMFALNGAALQSFFRERGLTYYVLGFGHTEQDEFPARIIEKYNLRPAVVVVNVDGFFADSQSEWAAKTIEESWFDAWKLQFEAEAAHAVRRRVHAVLPHYVDLQHGDREVVLYRSRDDGTWFLANDFGEGLPFSWPSEDRHEPSTPSLLAAEAFKQALEGRGARLVLCLVPSPRSSLHRARTVAAHLGVPLIAPTLGDLYSIDGSHLSATSSWRFGKEFLGELDQVLPSP
jgi:hypothetical protein